MNKFVAPLSMAVVGIFLLSADNCAPAPTSVQVEQARQERTTIQAEQSVGMPAIINYQEKRILKNIMELRDQQISTITYIVDLNGHLHKLCDSVGYGISAATQYTNPQQEIYLGNYNAITLPQADPNGLYSPTDEEGTYVMCLDPADKTLKAVYSEPRILVSPFSLDVK